MEEIFPKRLGLATQESIQTIQLVQPFPHSLANPLFVDLSLLLPDPNQSFKSTVVFLLMLVTNLTTETVFNVLCLFPFNILNTSICNLRYQGEDQLVSLLNHTSSSVKSIC